MVLSFSKGVITIYTEEIVMFYTIVFDDEYPDVWYNSKKDHFYTVECPVFPDHIRGERNDESLSIEIKRKKMGDFIFTPFCDCLITDKTAELFEKEGLTGYKLREVDVSNKVLPFKLWEIRVLGKAKITPDSGMKEIYRCEHCDLVMYGVSNDKTGAVIDESTWDGSDFFRIEQNQIIIFVTEKVKNVIDDHKLTGVFLVPSTELQLGYSETDDDKNWSKEQWKEYFEEVDEDEEI